jgi:cobalt transporter subunit CbtB
MSTAVTQGLTQRADTRLAAIAAFAFGVALVFTTGFAHSTMLHNAAHDTRHALSFPCH